jgi:hypothetical protein
MTLPRLAHNYNPSSPLPATRSLAYTKMDLACDISTVCHVKASYVHDDGF